MSNADAQGHFSINALSPGRYTLYAWESVQLGAYQNPEFLAKYSGRGTAVVVQASARISANVAVIRN